jgi:hypothetical protein
LPHRHSRARWGTLPVLIALAVPLMSAAPANAAAPGEYRGYLTSPTASSSTYVVTDSSGGTYFTSTPDTVDGSVGAVTGDGPTIAYVTEDDTATSYVDRLHLRTPAGADTIVYTGRPGEDLAEPSISSDGRDILFTADDSKSSAIVAVDTSSSVVRTVRSSTRTAYYGPSFSPDGTYLSWAQEDDTWSDVVVARFHTGAAAVLAHLAVNDVEFTDTAWSPVSGQLAVVRNEYNASIDDTVAALQLFDITRDTNRVVLHGSVDSSGRIVDYVEPAWTADGQNLLATKLTTVGQNTNGELVAISPYDGTEQAVPASNYAGSPSAAAPAPSDTDAPGPPNMLQLQNYGTSAHLTFTPPGAGDVADYIVTRVEGDAADTPTASIEITRTLGQTADVPLPAAATTYGISVFARDWSGNISPAAKVSVTSAPAATLTMSTPRPRINWRDGVKATGALTTDAGPVSGAKVTLYARRALTSTALPVASATTDDRGDYTLTYNPQWTAEYQVRFDGNASAFTTTSPKTVVTVVPTINFIPRTVPIRLGQTVALVGNMGPNHAGQIITFQRKVDGVWRYLTSTRLSASSTYRLVYKPNARGSWDLRAYQPSDGDHAAASSAGHIINVT